ncbi:hypothetical protein HK405_001344 [Cladochytrium tenue]|nr:hypothetical protein HK405_001344 [Cladochytrium tenue]
MAAAEPIKVGDSLPADIVLWTSGNSADKDACALPAKTSTGELFAGKRAVLVGIPIPFSPTCSMQQLPGFAARLADLAAAGAATVAIVNDYDVFVQDAWGKAVGHPDIKMLSDPDGSNLLARIGMLQDLSKGPLPLGSTVSKRFVLVLDNLKVVYLGVDVKGLSLSSVEAVLDFLAANPTPANL